MEDQNETIDQIHFGPLKERTATDELHDLLRNNCISIKDIVYTAILAAMDRNENNVTQSCFDLGMARTTMYRRLKELGLR